MEALEVPGDTAALVKKLVSSNVVELTIPNFDSIRPVGDIYIKRTLTVNGLIIFKQLNRFSWIIVSELKTGRGAELKTRTGTKIENQTGVEIKNSSGTRIESGYEIGIDNNVFAHKGYRNTFYVHVGEAEGGKLQLK
ncbi:hypothetical protein EVAR_9538_1 [Eumeta japonica]|uniref:Uncharacterized protein n=1 Tax=Eumeta variegata TaxID=151549 RepID=A0A4C1U4C1_EUMVA|nr:hypothetical protein EVAR_9538_1 [Eumeta japonica]